MKTRFTWLGIIAAVVIGITAVFVSCQKELNDIVRYRGEVVYINTTNPFPNLTVKVTNGRETHCQTLTDEAGLFELKVKVNEIDGNYYLLAGDSTCIPKQVALGGYGQAEVDLGVIEVEGPALPTVVTDSIVRDITADAAVIGGEVLTDGRMTVTARGICYGTSSFPTVDGLHTNDGTGLGTFTSHLKNLEHDAIYYARAYATNKLGTAYGEQVKFTTEEGVPVVQTDTIINITANSARCVGYVVSDGGYAVTARGTCWSTHHDPTIYDNCTNDGSGLKEFMSVLTNLQENTTYYVRAYATNSTTTKYGEEKEFTTLDGLAKVKTDSLTNRTATSFMAYGTVLADCDIPVTERGFCFSTSQYPTIDGKHIAVNKGLGSFHATISDLEYATTYYVRAYATNATATVYDSLQLEITTLTGLPTVVTDSVVTNIGSVKASCHGEVTDDGTLSVTARGICYGTEPQLTINDAHTDEGRGKGEFTSNLKNLKDSTVYYYRAYATTNAGTAYGKEYSFMTKNGVPVVKLEEVGTPTANSVICKGNVTGDGGVSITERGFCYSTSQYPTNTDSHIAIGNGTGEFTGSLTNLNINTTYYIRAYAVNSLGVGYSAQQSFTTHSGLPTITTSQPTSTATTISVGGEVTDNGGYAVSERGVCYSTTNSEPTIADQKVVSGRGNGTFNLAITGLAASTTYYVRAYAINENGTAYGNALTITTKNGAAIVTAGTISNITALSATGSVTVSDAGGANLQSCGICWATTPNPTIENNKVVGGNQINTAYSCNMTNLVPNTKYYVRAYATTDITTTYSEQVTFSTVSGLPVVTTGTPTTTATTITANGDVTDNGGYNVTERGFCYSTTNSEPTFTDNKIESGSGHGSFNASITGLSANTTYYIRAYATNSNGTAYGEIKSIQTQSGCAISSISEVTNITAHTASAVITITETNGATLQSCGICWSSNPNPTITDSKVIASGQTLNTPYTCNLSELQPNVKYYVRAFATTDVTTTYSTSKTFTTITGLPVVSTGATTSTANTFTCSGDVTSDAGYAVLERGICYSKTNGEPTILDPKVANGSGKGAFSITISELQPSTTYYIRAYATNSIGTAYGDVVSIMTKSGMATVITGAISNVKALTATGDVSVSDAGGALLLSCGICWSTIPNPTVTDNKSAGGNQLNTQYACNMTSLTPNTTYYVRAYAITDIATAYGEEVSYKTTTGLPALSTNTTTATSTIITSGGDIISDGGYSIIERGICYSTSNSLPTTSDQHISNGTGTGTYSCVIANVSVSTIYYVRAYATNNIGTAYGDVMTVQTGDGLPSVSTTDVGENLTESTAIAGGNITSDGGYSVTQRGVCWSTTPYPTISDGKTTDGSGTGYYSSTITGINLNDNTIIYYIRAYATNINGTAYGNQITLRKENLEYKNLPTFTYGGYKYHLYYDMGSMTREQGKQECQNLVFSGHNDWYLPNFTELRTAAEAQVGGWVSTTADGISTYWCSTQTVDFPYYYDYIVKVQVSADGIGTLYQAYSFLGGDGVARVFRIRAVRKDPVQ